MARELLERGAAALSPLPPLEALAREPAADRRRQLDWLRPEMYGSACVLADATMRRALRERASFPPYGLARSLYSQLRMISIEPRPFGPGSIETFRDLGMAYQDTLVYHLHGQLAETRLSEQAWLLQRLEELLALFREDADPAGKARMRDALSFLYGGLQFGMSVCVQLAEVMARVLLAEPAARPEELPGVLARSSRPAYRLASLNVEDVVAAYEELHRPPEEDERAPGGPTPSGWMHAGNFAVRVGADGLARVDLVAQVPSHRGPGGSPPAYTTLGCPARVSPSGGRSAISDLWGWCVDLAGALGLLRPPGGGVGPQEP